MLLVTPASLTTNWAREIDKWVGRAQLPYALLGEGGRKPQGQVADFCSPSYRGREEAGPPPRPRRHLPGSSPALLPPSSRPQVLILSYEAAQQHTALLKAAPPFALLVSQLV